VFSLLNSKSTKSTIHFQSRRWDLVQICLDFVVADSHQRAAGSTSHHRNPSNRNTLVRMKTPKAIISAAAYCAVATTTAGFQPTAIFARTVSSLNGHHADNNDHDQDVVGGHDYDDFVGPLGGTSSEAPRSLGSKGTFLGMRRESGVMRRMMDQQRQQEAGRAGTALSSSPTALMPDGGLSPCVIKVLGVGGGGSNAVSQNSAHECLLYGMDMGRGQQ